MEFIHLATSHAIGGFAYLVFGVGLILFVVERWHSVHAQRVANLIAFTRNHREIWTPILNDPDLTRILDPKADLTGKPLTLKESSHVKFLILQLYASFTASKKGMFVPSQNLPKEIADFLALPIPRAVWDQLREWQDDDFVAFVENALRDHGEQNAKD